MINKYSHPDTWVNKTSNMEQMEIRHKIMSEDSLRLIGKALDFILVNGELDVDIDNTEYEQMNELVEVIESELVYYI